MATVKHHKVVAALPAVLEANAIYYVRAGQGHDVYVTNSSGVIVGYPANAALGLAGKVDKVEGQSLMTDAERTKLAGIQAGATANATNAQLRDRATHTGTQAISTVSGLQAALDAKLPAAQKGAASGVASLDANAKVPLAQLPDSIIGQVEYMGTWNAATNTPTLPTTPAEKGHYYVISTAGSRFGHSFEVGDWCISNGSSWDKVDNTDAVSSVNGRTGNVTGLAEATDPRLSDAREWTATTVTQSEAEQGTSTTRRAWTAQRVFQAVAAWWAASADKTKLDGIQAGAQVNVGTNLAQGTRTTTAVPVTSSTGTGATLGAATTSLAGVMTAADKTKLDGVATGATANATDAQLRDRTTHTGSQAISTVSGLQTALDGKINTSERGVSGGVATLDQFAMIPASQLPSYVDDVLEFQSLANFPAVGEGGKIYIAINQGTAANPTRQYRWTGSVYAEINPSPGTTDALTEGSTNLYFNESRVRNTVLTGLSPASSAAVAATDTVLTAFGKIQGRLNLLGTAANANVQTSPTDTTAGALMAVGAFGGDGSTTNVNFPSTSVDDHTAPNGRYRVFRTATPNGTHPPGLTGDYMLTVVGRYSATHVAQLAQFYVNGAFRQWTRQVNNGVGTPWTELFHDGNFNPATKADIASPALTGTPTAPTPAVVSNSTLIATTAFVQAVIATKQDKSTLITTATGRTLALTDAWNYLRPGTTSAITLTVPTNASVAFAIGTEITIRALGNVTLAAASGVTLNAPSGGTLSMTARMTVTLKKVGANEWDVVGQTVAA